MMPTALPILRGFMADDVVVRVRTDGGLRALSASRFCGACRALAARLPHTQFAINICESPADFVLASCAALLARQTLVLPPVRLARSLVELRAMFPDSYVVADRRAQHLDDDGGQKYAVDAAGPDGCGDAEWPPPAVTGSHKAAILFTSGSTGDAEPQVKSWESLVRGAQTFLRSLGPVAPQSTVIGTVAPQHMFGLETTVVLPLQTGAVIAHERPIYPADLADILGAAPGDAWLMTTPLQLRAFHREVKAAPGLVRVISSTMPLPVELAAAVERDWQVPVAEIYGCSEGGMLATRHPTRSIHFVPAAGLEFTIGDDGEASVEGGQLAGRLALDDRLRWMRTNEDSGIREFGLIGRNGDMVKIAGKRASLTGLTQRLLAVPGVVDGVFFLSREEDQRVAAVAVAPEHTVPSLRIALASAIDPAFLPRPLLLVQTLPRDANGKVSRGALR